MKNQLTEQLKNQLTEQSKSIKWTIENLLTEPLKIN